MLPLRRRVFLEITLLDTVLKVTIAWAAIDLMGLEGAARAQAAFAFAPTGAFATLLWLAVMYVVLAPYERWARVGDAGDDGALRAASAALRRAPVIGTAVGTVAWLIAVVPPCVWLASGPGDLDVPAIEATGLALLWAAVAIGAATFTFSYLVWALGAPMGRISLAARARGLTFEAKRTSLRTNTAVLALGVAFAPTSWVTSMTYFAAVQDEATIARERVARAASELAHRLRRGEPAAIELPGGGGFRVDAAGVVTPLVGAAPPSRELLAHASAARDGVVSRHGAIVALVREGTGAVGVAYPAPREAAHRVLRRVAIFFSTVLIYALLTAIFLSSNVVNSVKRVAAALREIARTGGVQGARRLPLLQRDEIGALLESANEMIDRLAEAQQASAKATDSLREANAQLEERVARRTALLRASNQELMVNLDSLQQARSQLAEAARRAGMAEVATAVIHNVGNALNGVTVSTSLLADRLRPSTEQLLQRAVELVPDDPSAAARFFADDARARSLPTYLRRISAELAAQHGQARDELANLVHNVDRIVAIIDLQQQHTRHAGVVEPIVLAGLVDDAVRSSVGTLDVMVVRELAELPPIVADRHRLFEILVNLLRNAHEAMASLAPAERRIVVRARAAGDQRVAIDVVDAGCGIAPEQLTRIFHFGFTTKPGGNGYGLHAAALAAQELGGALDVTSDGVGRGATFTLTLPLRTPAAGTADAPR